MSMVVARRQICLSLLSTRKKTLNQIYSEMTDAGFSVGKRTVLRDLEVLSLNFPVVCDTENPKQFLWGLSDNTKVDLAGMFTHDQALSFLMLRQFSARLLPIGLLDNLSPYFAKAELTLNMSNSSQRKYRNLSSEDEEHSMRNWLGKIQMLNTNQKLLAPAVDEVVKRQIYQAVLRGVKINLSYKKDPLARDSDIKLYREVSAFGLIEHGAGIYVVVFFSKNEQARTLALHRIKSVEVLEKPREIPVGVRFDKKYAEQVMGLGGDNQEISLHLKFYEGAGRHLLEMPLAHNQLANVIDATTLEITATLPQNKRLENWLLGFGGNLEVLSPPGLRQKIQEELFKGFRRYDSLSS